MSGSKKGNFSRHERLRYFLRPSLLLGALAATGVAVAATQVGAIPGAFSVSANGAAAYSIPIDVPRGSGGLTPSIGLAYDSQSGNGMAGYGWNVTGFSSITRCNSAIYDDGEAAAVQLVQGDDYCLDGQRLRRVGGTYGGNATYGTEIEGFSLIKSYTDSGVAGGPGHFTVQTKDGTVYEYGNTSGSRVLAQGTSVARIWALDRVTDVNGNYITFTYTQDATAGDYWPTAIKYTGNDNNGSAPLHTIQFDWVTRSSASAQASFIAGSQASQTQLLQDIKVVYNGSTTFTYTLGYQTDAATGHDLLSSVTECGSNGDCFNPTQITWQTGQAGWDADTNTGVTISDAAHAQSAYLMDVDGDGIADLVYPDTHWMVLFGQSGGGFVTPAVDTGKAATNYQYSIPLEFNGDGRADLLYPNPSDNKWHVLQSLGGRATYGVFTDVGTAIADTYYGPDTTVADVSGHGLHDLLYSNGSTLYIARNTGGGFAAPQVLVASSNSTTKDFETGSVSHFSQFRGAGMDFVGSGRGGRIGLYGVTTTTTCGPDSNPGCQPTSTTNYTWQALTPSGSGSSVSYSSTGAISGGVTLLGQSVPATVDMNGDGLSDMLTADTPSGQDYTQYDVYLSSGTQLTDIYSVLGYASSEPLFVDYYGNGRQTMLVKAYQSGTCNSSSGWCAISISYDPTHHAFLPQASAVSAPYPFNYVPGTLRIGDTTGRGLSDLVYAIPNGSAYNWHYALHSGVRPDLVTGITDGLGNIYTPHYSTLAGNATIYTKGPDANWPVVVIQPALNVVRNYTFNDATGGTSKESYTYSGLQQDATGLFLGFATRGVTDSRNGVTTTDYFDQDFPYIGQVDKETVAQQNGELISQTTNDLQNSQLGTAQGEVRYFVSIASSTFESHDIGDGSLLKTVTSTNRGFDAYGDVTDLLVKTHDEKGALDYQVHTVTTFADSAGSYCINAPLTVKLTNTEPGGTISGQRISDASVNFDYTHCRPNQVTVTSGTETDPAIDAGDGLSLTTTYQYDVWGNVSGTTLKGTGLPAAGRGSTVTYANNGEYPGIFTNALGQVSSKTWRSDFGMLATDKDANGNQTAYDYDGFGRLKSVTRPDGTVAGWAYGSCSSGCTSGASYLIAESVQDADATQILNPRTTEYDSQGRVVRVRSTLLGGVVSYVKTVYDSLGRVIQASNPYFTIADRAWTFYNGYDVLNRVGQTLQPVNASMSPADGTDTAHSVETDFTYLNYTSGYAGFATVATTTDHSTSETQTTARVENAIGQVTSMVDAGGGITQYTYDSFGDLAKITAVDNRDTTMVYDGLGHKVAMTDPDMGHWTYAYDALGELLTQTDAKGQKIVQTYDDLARLATRNEFDAGNTQTVADTWSYDSAPNGIGLPASVSDTNGYAKQYGYDSLSRPSTLDTTIGGTDYQITTTYDSLGRVATVQYPASATPSTSSPPVAQATASATAIDGGGTVSLDGSTSSDPNGYPLQYTWSLVSQPSGSNVSIVNPGQALASATLVQGGDYVFHLVVQDADAASTPASVTVTVLTPSAPTQVQVTPSPSIDGDYTLSWTTPSGSVSGFYVYESANGGAFGKVATIPFVSGTTGYSYPCSGRGNGSYQYYVIAYNSAGPGAASGTVTENVYLPPGKPTGVGVSSPNPSITGNYQVYWSQPSGVTTYYQIWESSGGAFSMVKTTTLKAVNIPPRTNGTYNYYVVACNTSAACGNASAQASITVLLTPAAPTLSGSPTTFTSGGTVNLSWQSNGGSISSYTLQRTDTDTGTVTTPYSGPNRSFSQTLTKVTTFRYVVKACNSASCSTGSNFVSVMVTTAGGGGGQLMVQGGTTQTAAPAPTTTAAPASSTTAAPASGTTGRVQPVPVEDDSVPISASPAATALAALSDLTRARQVLVAETPRQPPESSFQAAAFRREQASLPSVLPAAPAADVAAWQRSQALRDRAAPGYAAPVYIAYGGARLAPATGSPYRFTVRYSYDPASGRLAAVSDANTGFVYWQAALGGSVAPVDAYGHLIAYVDGNNVSTVTSYDTATGRITGIGSGIGQSSSVQQLTYAWDGLGNLTQRCDRNRDLAENFSYDSLNRLKASNVYSGVGTGCAGGTAGTSTNLVYDALGNITSRTGLGTYHYDDPNHPRAVTAVDGLPGTYQYDENGNQYAGNNRSITWNVDNLPTGITSNGTVNGNNVVTGTSTFSYGPGGERYQQIATDSTGTTTTTYVAGGLFEVVTAGGSTQYRHTILAGGAVAIHTVTAAGAVTTAYLHSDHLGSSDTLTDEKGVVSQGMSFDAFGLRRDPANWAYDLTPGDISGLKGTTDRGYTLQEQLDNVGLVHLNGRVYEPAVGRFISTDPTIPDALYGEAYDRYSYVYNRPLIMTDQSGYAGLYREGSYGLPGTSDYGTGPQPNFTPDSFGNVLAEAIGFMFALPAAAEGAGYFFSAEGAAAYGYSGSSIAGTAISLGTGATAAKVAIDTTTALYPDDTVESPETDLMTDVLENITIANDLTGLPDIANGDLNPLVSIYMDLFGKKQPVPPSRGQKVPHTGPNGSDGPRDGIDITKGQTHSCTTRGEVPVAIAYNGSAQGGTTIYYETLIQCQ